MNKPRFIVRIPKRGKGSSCINIPINTVLMENLEEGDLLELEIVRIKKKEDEV